MLRCQSLISPRIRRWSRLIDRLFSWFRWRAKVLFLCKTVDCCHRRRAGFSSVSQVQYLRVRLIYSSVLRRWWLSSYIECEERGAVISVIYWIDQTKSQSVNVIFHVCFHRLWQKLKQWREKRRLKLWVKLAWDMRKEIFSSDFAFLLRTRSLFNGSKSKNVPPFYQQRSCLLSS